MLLIVENSLTNNWDVQSAINESAGQKNYFIEGIVMQAGILNKNGRIYPEEVLFEETERYTKEMVEGNRAYGELGHPDSPTVNLDRASHIFKEINIDGKNVHGKAKIIDTPKGKIVKSLIDEGGVFGCSSRSLGNLKRKPNNVMEVQRGMKIAAIDIVADPSAPESFVQGIMEGREWMVNEYGIWVEMAKQRIEKASSRELESLKIALFEEFMNKV